MEDLPPVFSSVSEAFDEATVGEQRERLEKLKKAFEDAFGHAPEFFARAPGRVNLIGEHIDYSGYSVLPMAVEKDIIMAVSKNDSAKINLHNVNAAKYPARSYGVHDFKIDQAAHEWSNYFLAGFKGLCEDAPLKNPVGMNIVVDGRVPAGAGLSSSSAMVCCSILATCHANDLKLSKTRTAQIAITGERNVGVESGGMDQTISIMGEKGKAKLVDFHPHLLAHDVVLPEKTVFVTVDSLVTSDKKVTAPRNYNLRVVECRLASVLLNSFLETEFFQQGSDEILTLLQVQKRFTQSLGQMLDHVNKYLHPEPFTRQELAGLLKMPVQDLEQKYMSRFPIEAEGFELHKRALHVFSEAERVLRFKEICDMPPYPTQLEDLGNLMNGSHESCQKMFNCSCPEVDKLVQICREEGALGSRLTGAGWGGCTVSLVEEDKVSGFIDRVKKRYFETSDPPSGAIFASKPSNGALILSGL